MIELRWIEKEETITRLGCTLVEKVKVLQFREGTKRYDLYGKLCWVGPDWQDVPTVRENDTAL